MGSINANTSSLYQKLKEFQIVTGKFGPNEISAWYDTFDKSTINFLDWFEKYITSENFITCTEALVYEELVKKNLTFEPEKYKQVLQELQLAYPNLHEEDFNKIDCDLLEFENGNLDENLNVLEKLIATYKEENKYLNKLRSDKMDEYARIKFKKDEQAAICLTLANSIDEINLNLNEQLLIYSNTIDKSESFICTRCDYFEQNTELMDKCNLNIVNICTSELENVPSFVDNLPSFMETSFNDTSCSNISNASMFCVNLDNSLYNSLVNKYEKSTEIMRARLIQAISQRIDNYGRVKVKLAQLKYFDDLSDITTGHKTYNLNGFSNTCYKEAVEKRVENLIHIPTVAINEKYLSAINAKTEYFMSIQEKLKTILQYQALQIELLSIEINMFKDNKSVALYLDDYTQCEERTKIMSEINKEYNSYLCKPFEEKWGFLKEILKIIEANYEKFTLDEALQSIKEFHQKSRELEEKLFLNDIDKFFKDVRLIETTNKKLKNYLSSDTTSELTVISYDTYSSLKSYEDMVKQQENLVKHYMNMPKEITKKLDSNKWLKHKRTLWMYFLKKPEKMERILTELESELQKKRADFFK